MSRPSYGVIVGRFQVHELHEGHRELIDGVYARHTRVIIFLGVSPTGMTKKHPLDFETRKRLIQASYPEALILPLQDVMTDEMWSRNLDAKIREVAVYGDITLYGGRDSFVPHYKGDFKPMELALTKLNFSGEAVRAGLTNRVMNSADFRAGVIYGAMNSFPRVVTTVDAVVWHHFSISEPSVSGYKWREVVELLLGKKAGEPGWRFIGGHSEPSVESFEADVCKEVREEAKVYIGPADCTYIGSCVVPDWRWASEESKVKTLIFACETQTLEARAGDDLDEVKWFKAEEIDEQLFVPTHRPLFEIVRRYFRRVQEVEFKDANAVQEQSAVTD